MPTATKIPGFTADASIHNTGTYWHTPVGRGAELPAVVEPALPPGVVCWTQSGMRQCAFSTTKAAPAGTTAAVGTVNVRHSELPASNRGRAARRDSKLPRSFVTELSCWRPRRQCNPSMLSGHRLVDTRQPPTIPE